MAPANAAGTLMKRVVFWYNFLKVLMVSASFLAILAIILPYFVIKSFPMKRLAISVLIISTFSTFSMAQQYPDNSLGSLVSFSQDGKKINLQTTNGRAEVIVYGPGIVRVRICKQIFDSEFSYAVIAEPQECEVSVKDESSQVVLATDSLIVNIAKDPVRFTFLTKDGQLLNEDDPAFGTTWVGEEVNTYKTLQEGEHFTGLGEKTGNLDRRGESHTNWNTDNYAYRVTDDEIYSSFPFYVGVHHGLCYGIYFDNTHKAYFNFGASNDRFSSFGADAGDMDYYFIHGRNIPEIIERYTWLTGRMPMPPVWALGFQQCRWSYFPDTEVLNIARNFREKKIPLDVMYLDIHYMDAYKVFTWHPERFSNPSGTLAALKEIGIRTTVIIDPGVKVEEGYDAYEDGVKQDVFIKYPDGTDYTAQVWPGWCHFPDFTRPDARKWWGDKFSGLVNDGVEGFWNDMNEIASWGEGATPTIVRLDWEGTGASYKKAKNVYGMLMSRSTYEGTRELMQGRRPLILTRAAFSGAQRYTAKWTGDNAASEEHMMLGVRLVNSLGISGMAFSGVDVGGFSGESTPNLFARWITIGAFTPFFRVHKEYNQKSSEPWSYGEDIETISRNYISLRYRLLPYLYSAFYEAHTTGMPINRPLILDHMMDENCWKNEYQHEYLFGPNLLVAPVESAQKAMKVYLPEGTWYDFFTGEKYTGGQEIFTECPLDKLPVFARGGGFIPMQSITQSTMEKPDDIQYLHVYFGDEKASFLYYEDDGLSYDYEEGKYLTRRMVFDPENRQIILEKPEGNYPGRFSKISLIIHGFTGAENEFKVNGKAVLADITQLDLYTALDQKDPLYNGGRKFEQEVRKLDIVDFDQRTVVSWK